MPNRPQLSFIDRLITESDKALRTLATGNKASGQASPARAVSDGELSDDERRHAASLMRVNHTGEVCAQALYQGQSLTAKLPHVREEMEAAAKEEADHLHWCDERLKQLNSHSSALNPLFYGLSFGMGALAGAVSDKVSLGFVAATEDQVCQHLEKHLDQLPTSDHKSRAIIEKMLEDEARHKQSALEAGGSLLPSPVRFGMSLMSKVMTKTAYHI
jgi:ubiquinone biosynthesis monooxygenase Coq7